jgi:hypothetical protein
LWLAWNIQQQKIVRAGFTLDHKMLQASLPFREMSGRFLLIHYRLIKLVESVIELGLDLVGFTGFLVIRYILLLLLLLFLSLYQWGLLGIYGVILLLNYRRISVDAIIHLIYVFRL